MASLRRKAGLPAGFIAPPGATACKQILGLGEGADYVDSGSTGTGMMPAPDAGPDAEHLPPTAGQCGSLTHPSATCADCMDQNCCTEATACHDDSSCNVAFDCLAQCADDGACRARCTQFYNRDDALLKVHACREKSCSAACGLSCGGFGYPVPSCDACIRSTCCQLAASCAKVDDCQRLDLCHANCLTGSMSCPAECEAQF